MYRTRIIVAVVLSGVVGLSVGAFGALKFSSWMHGEMAVSTAAAAVAVNASALKSLRGNESPDAIARLEAELDGDLIFIANYPGAAERSDVQRVLSLAREYRSANPRSSGDPKVDAAVLQVLGGGKK